MIVFRRPMSRPYRAALPYSWISYFLWRKINQNRLSGESRHPVFHGNRGFLDAGSSPAWRNDL